MPKNRLTLILCCWLLKKTLVIATNLTSPESAPEEELDYIDIDDIGNIEHSPRLVFINVECGNLMIVHINQKKKPDVVQSLIGVHSAKNVVGQSIYSIAMWNIYCESGKHGFPCDFFNYRIK